MIEQLNKVVVIAPEERPAAHCKGGRSAPVLTGLFLYYEFTELASGEPPPPHIHEINRSQLFVHYLNGISEARAWSVKTLNYVSKILNESTFVFCKCLSSHV